MINLIEIVDSKRYRKLQFVIFVIIEIGIIKNEVF